MNSKDKYNFINKLLVKHIEYKDGFWVLDGKVSHEAAIRRFIKNQGLITLEKDITDILSELSYTDSSFDVDQYFKESLEKLATQSTEKSIYFKSMDELYPGNKFREIMNYYLFGEDCYSFVLIGYGQTGKTTFVNLIGEIMEGFFGRSNVSLLRNSHGTAIIEGKKIFEVAEAQDLDLDTANMLKSIITNDEIYINPKFQLPRTIKPHVKLIMTCNNMPRFKVTDDGVIRRFIIIKMDNKIEKQDRHFIEKMREDIPNIIKEAMEHPFNIADFAEEQYAIFENDAQWGYGYGLDKIYDNDSEYEKYKSFCKSNGFLSRNRANFDKFIELAKIYGGRCNKCGTTSSDLTEKNGTIQYALLEDEDSPFDL